MAMPLSIDAALDLGITLAGALHALHQAGLVHRDIKPTNIGFTQGGVVKLLDFGLATVREDGRPHLVPMWYALDDEGP